VNYIYGTFIIYGGFWTPKRKLWNVMKENTPHPLSLSHLKVADAGSMNN
jgi:hypothetical protein